ncbi:hypothetical protein [Methylomonas rivi]|uniref:Uncharacterized protein n=1 Tax=Methylomonas rivi TaxID=2952226 RepID=A0ABT1U1N2_9GAMM|nr:hypothetical protein [Methylomonas sp. WSC-6]MCQ8127733.1 hypothetical protein [Methylomonas sp. WSC-6]
MQRLAQLLCKLTLPKVLGRACEAIIPRSGEKGAKVNCFVTSIDRAGEPYLIVLGLIDDDLNCIEWDGTRYSIERTISINSLRLSDFRITHYYGHSEIQFFGLLDFVRNRLMPCPYLKIHVIRRLNSLDQYLFNKKKLVTKQRTDLLKYLIERALDGKNEHEPLDLMTDLHSIKWVLHPHGAEEQRKLEFYLEALVDTGELRKINCTYVLTGFALRAIEDYEEQERKHTENVKMQWRTFWLTSAIVALTVVQAGIVKLPALIDWTSK